MDRMPGAIHLTGAMVRGSDCRMSIFINHITSIQEATDDKTRGNAIVYLTSGGFVVEETRGEILEKIAALFKD